MIGPGLKRTNLHSFQKRALAFIRHKRKCALFLDMGLGKSVIALTAASDMLDEFLINKVLVIAPLRVSTNV